MVRAFANAHPGVSVSLVWMSKKQQINALRDGRIHIAFGRYYDSDPEVMQEVLCHEKVYAAVSSDTPIYHQDSVTVAELATLPMILYPVRDHPSMADEVISMFRQKKVSFQLSQSVPDLTAALALVGCGNRCTVVTEGVAALRFPGLRFLPVSDSAARVPTSYVVAARNQSPVLRPFLDMLRDPDLWDFAVRPDAGDTPR